MKVLLIAGSRDLNITFDMIDEQRDDLLFHLAGVELVVSGLAVGPDTVAEQWAKARRKQFKGFPVTRALYDQYGKLAPKVRNRNMARYLSSCAKEGRPAGALLFWDGMSGGTAHMCAQIAGREEISLRMVFCGATNGR